MTCQKQSNMSPWTQTMKYHTTNLERLQTLSLQCQCYLSSQDQHPAHNPLTSTTSTSLQGPSASTISEDESADNDDAHGERESGPTIQSARSHDSGRSVLRPDLYVLTIDEHWTMTPEAHKCAAAKSRSFCFVISENGAQQDVCNLIIMPCVCSDHYASRKRLMIPAAHVLYSQTVLTMKTREMLERCMATCGKAAGTRSKRKSRAREEASAQEVRGYYKQFARPEHLEWKFWIDRRLLTSLI